MSDNYPAAVVQTVKEAYETLLENKNNLAPMRNNPNNTIAPVMEMDFFKEKILKLKQENVDIEDDGLFAAAGVNKDEIKDSLLWSLASQKKNIERHFKDTNTSNEVSQQDSEERMTGMDMSVKISRWIDELGKQDMKAVSVAELLNYHQKGQKPGFGFEPQPIHIAKSNPVQKQRQQHHIS